MSDNLQEKYEEAIALHTQGNFAQAKQLYLEIFQLVDSVDLYILIAKVCLDLKQYDEAITFAQDGLQMEHRVELIEILAYCYNGIGNLSNAVKYFKMHIGYVPNSVQSKLMLAKLFYKAKDYYTAAKEYIALQSLDPSFIRPYEPIGNILGDDLV